MALLTQVERDLFATDDPATTASLRNRIITTSERYMVDPALMLALAHRESRYNPQAVSPTGVTGLFQVTNATGRPYGQTPQTRTDPDVSMDVGIRHFRDLLKATKGDVRQALARYGDPNEADYPDKVLSTYPLQTQTVPQTPLTTTLMQRTAQSMTPEGRKGQRQTVPVSLDVIEQELFGPSSPARSNTASPSRSAPAPQQKLDDIDRDLFGEQPVSPEQSSAVASPPVQSTVPSDLTVEIAKTSTPGQAEIDRRIDEMITREQATTNKALYQDMPAMAAQVLGSMGGAALGSLTSPVTGPIGPAVGAAIGGSLATRATNALGLTQPEQPIAESAVANLYPSDLLGALPVPIAATVAAGKRLLPTLPGVSRVMHEMGETRLGQLASRLGPSTPSDDLFAQAAKHNPPIVPVSLRTTADDLLRRELALPPSVQQSDIIRVARDMQQLSQQPGAVIPLQDLDNIRKRVGLLVRQANTENWPQATGLKAIYGSIMDDIATAAQHGVPGAQTLRGAIQAYRQERGLEGLMDLWSPGKGIQLEQGDITRVYGKRIQNQFEKRIKDDKLFAGSFTPDELTDIRDTLKDVARLTSRAPTHQGGWVGEGIKWLGRLAGVGELSTGNVPAAAGLVIAAEAAPAVISAAMQSRVGRWALLQALEEGQGMLSPTALSGLASVVFRAQGLNLPSETQPSEPTAR
jgi:hypothetical protein